MQLLDLPIPIWLSRLPEKQQRPLVPSEASLAVKMNRSLDGVGGRNSMIRPDYTAIMSFLYRVVIVLGASHISAGRRHTGWGASSFGVGICPASPVKCVTRT